MLSHVLRVKGSGVKPCKGRIHPDAHKRYMTLHEKGKVKNESRKRVSEDVVDNVDCTQKTAIAALQTVRKKQLLNQNIDANQMCIEAGFERAVCTDIRRSFDAGLEMAIADFFHCENIPDNVVKSYRFKKMLQQARLVGKDFKIPDRRKIGGKYFFLILFFAQ